MTWKARLNPSSPRYRDWRRILRTDRVPIVAPYRFPAILGAAVPMFPVVVSALDLEKLSGGQRRRLVDYASERFGTSREQAEQYMAREGFPIRADDVIITIEIPAVGRWVYNRPELS